jgi:hypothetical protein
LHRAESERSPFVADATDRDDGRSRALVNAAKFAAAYSRIAILAQQLNRAAQLFEIMELFFPHLRRSDAVRGAIAGMLGQPSKFRRMSELF